VAPVSVQASWDNHFAAFGALNLEQILLDYTEDSIITVYDQTSGSNTVFAGMAGVRECFEGLFGRLTDLSDLAAPVADVQEAAGGEPGSVFLIWSCPASGYAEATDTFIFDGNAKILRQNVVVVDTQSDASAYPLTSESPTGSGAVHDGFSNHFAAFGGQDVEQIMLDYTEESVITVFNHVTGQKDVFEGLDGVRSCFVGLFASLPDTSDLGAPIIHVEEGGSAQVFLIWRAPASGYDSATDTFIFSPEGKILRQNVVVHYEVESPTVQASWDNHFAAFGALNLEQILLDYTEDSIITVYDQTSGSNTVFAGMAGVRECFEGLFGRLTDLSDLAAPVADVQEAAGGEPGSVFLIWSCPASGYAEATDTFIFDGNAKILRQNVVVVDTQSDASAYPLTSESPTGSGAVHDGFSNHFAAFGGQDVEQIMLDYTEESVITVFNHVTGQKDVFEGLDGVRSCFVGLFASLPDTSDLGAPIIHVEEGGSAQVFLIWRAPASGYDSATDTFIFSPEGKILRQNVVVHYEVESPTVQAS